MSSFYKRTTMFVIKLCFLASILIVNTSFSAEKKATIDLQKSFESIKADFESKIKVTDEFAQHLDLIDDKQKEFSALEIKLDECIAKNSSSLETLKENLKLLGEEVKSEEDKDIKNNRNELNEQSQSIENELKRCSLTKIQLKEFTKEINEQRLDFLTKQILSKEVSVFSAVGSLVKRDKTDSVTIISDEINKKSTASLLKVFKTSLSFNNLLFILFGIFLGWLWQRKESDQEINPEQYASPTFISIVRGIQRTAPILFGFLFLWAAIQFSENPQDSLLPVVRLIFLLMFAYAVFRGYLFPQKTLARAEGVPRYKLFTYMILAVSFCTIAYLLNEQTLGRFSNSTMLFLAWFISLVVSTVSFILILQYIIQYISKESPKSIYLYIPMLLMASLLVAAFLGYRNLASLVFFGLIISMIIVFFMYLLIRISSEFFDTLDQGKIPWQLKVRHLMSVEDGRAFPGVIWLRMLVFFAAVFAALSALVTVWGGPQQHISSIKGVLQNGFKLGSVQVDVTNIIYALLIMVITLSMLPFIKNRLIAEWLKHSNLSSGAKDATQTLIGYVVVAFALLWALFILGMNFQNLAIIAGALSVGIGFGLQNIVNNFVSGLILLFERPVRRGDWIVVGNTEGYVRDISIRSTKIQTFDRADVIVPNSELISNQVTNWMLSSNVGRLKAAVGVAYGSDVKKVMEILTKISEDHPEVISHNNAYPTRVFFLAFGDSSLDFELRCFVKNIENVILIRSEINISIDAAFREHNIEIPFPQRVVHMQNNDEN